MRNLLLIFTLSLFTFNTIFSQGLEVYNSAQSYPGYTLYPLSNKAYLIDNCGKLINEWSFNNSNRLATYLMPNGNLFWLGALSPNTFTGGGGSSGSMEIRDKDNFLLWSYSYYVPDEYATHHDVEILPNGNILLIVWEENDLTESIAFGRNPSTVINNEIWSLRIDEIEPVGTNQINVVWQWRVTDHVIQDYSANAANYGVIAHNPQLIDANAGPNDRDWLHCNGIDYNADLDQIIVSSRDLNEVFIIDHSTTTAEAASHTGGIYGKGGDLLYRWGNPASYDRGNGNGQILEGQHDPRWIRKGFANEGAISIFNNFGGIAPNTSSVEIFFPPMDSAGFYTQPLDSFTAFAPNTSAFTYTNGPEGNFFTGNQGGAQVLPNGNVLIFEANSKRQFELNPSTNSVVWQYLSPGNGSVFKGTRYLASDIELSTYDLTPGSTIEIPSSSISTNCNSIVYPAFCLSNLTGFDALTGSEFNTDADYETDGIIESTQTIEAGAAVDYDTNSEIILLPGFEIKLNADFYAIIDGCNFGSGGLN